MFQTGKIVKIHLFLILRLIMLLIWLNYFSVYIYMYIIKQSELKYKIFLENKSV